jgi:hypothetical protein
MTRGSAAYSGNAITCPQIASSPLSLSGIPFTPSRDSV